MLIRACKDRLGGVPVEVRATVLADVMTTDVLTVSGGATLSQAARAMRSRNVGSAIVIDPDTCPIGIITERELVDSVASSRNPDHGTVELWMKPEPATASPDMLPIAAAELMREHSVRQLPVTESGKLVGVVSIRDLLVSAQR